MILCILYLIIFAALAYGFMKLDCNPLLAFYERFFPNKDKLRGKTVWVVGASTGKLFFLIFFNFNLSNSYISIL